MGYKIGVLTLHGMGAQKKGYSASWEENIRGKLSTEACEEVVFEEVYYQDIMQREQMNLWENRLDWETKSLCPLALVILLGVTVWVAAWVAALVTAVIRNWGVVDSLALALGLTALTIALAIATVFAVAKLQHRVWVHVRKFLLYAFSDPATYAYKYDEPGSIYQQVHKRVSARLKSLCEKLDEDGCVVVVAHSLGAHVLSNHIWDAEKRLKRKEDGTADCQAESEECKESEQEYERIKKIERIFTAGANITLFVAGRPEVKPFAKPNDCFEWHNLYDEDDVLGWPLQQLPPKDERSYADLVKVERRIDVDGPCKSWNPLSHNEYLGPGTEFIKHVVKEIEELHQEKLETKSA